MKSQILRGNLRYLFWVIVLILLIFFKIFGPSLFNNPFIFLIFSLPILVLPGFLITSFFKVNEGLIGKILLWFLLSLGFYFLIGLILFIFKANITAYFWVNLVLILILLFISFVFNLPKPSGFDYKPINFRGENIYFLIPIFLILFCLIALAGNSPEINGDPYFHLSIINKAFEGKSFGARELYLTKLSDLNPAYLLPVWHVFLAFLAKIFNLNILVLWQNLILPLFIMTALAWYYLFKKIFDNKFTSIVGLSLFLIFYFYGTGYIFARLPVPDTLSQLILMPLSLAFLIGYSFSGKKIYLMSLGLASILLLLVHTPHYFYLLLFALVFLIMSSIWAIFKKEYRANLMKILAAIICLLIPLAIFFIGLVILAKNLPNYLQSFRNQELFILSYGSFSKFTLVYKYGYFLLPLAIIINKNYPKRIIVILSLLLITPLVYFTPLKDVLGRLLSNIFTDRLLVNTSLYFLTFTLFLGPILIYVYSKISTLNQRKKDLAKIIIFALIFFIIVLQFTTGIIAQIFYKELYDKGTFAFINNHLIIVWILFLTLAFLGLFFTKIYKEIKVKQDFSTFLITLALIFMFFTPSFEYLPLNKIFNFSRMEKITSTAYFLPIMDYDQEFLNYINVLSCGKVIMADPEVTKALAVLSKQYVAYAPGSSWEKNLMLLYDQKSSDSLMNTLILSPKYNLDYIVVKNQDSQSIQRFLNNPNLKLVYKNNLSLYQVIK